LRDNNPPKKKKCDGVEATEGGAQVRVLHATAGEIHALESEVNTKQMSVERNNRHKDEKSAKFFFKKRRRRRRRRRRKKEERGGGWRPYLLPMRHSQGGGEKPQRVPIFSL
jgi:hypothetical protein